MDAVVVSFNSASDLEMQLGCRGLRSAFDRVIVVDNASSDASVDVARAMGAEVVERDANDSFSAAVNAGIEAADGEVVAILNPDILLDDAATVGQLAEHFDDPTVGLAAPALVLPDGRRQDSARTVPSPGALVRRRLTGSDDGALYENAPHDVPWVVAAFMLVRRSAFDSVGGFDTGYRLYFEDVDFCVRMWSHGWRVVLDPTQVARHEHRASSRRALFGWAMRRHTASAVRFFSLHPDMLLDTGRRRLMRASRTT